MINATLFLSFYLLWVYDVGSGICQRSGGQRTALWSQSSPWSCFATTDFATPEPSPVIRFTFNVLELCYNPFEDRNYKRLDTFWVATTFQL